MKTKLLFRFVLLAILLVLPISLTGCGTTAQGKVVDEIMKHMSAHDAAAAFEHMSSLSRDAGVTVDALAAFITDYAVLVDGYENMSVSNMTVSTNEGLTTTELVGTFSYQDGTSSDFDAFLHKEGEIWMVTELNINK